MSTVWVVEYGQYSDYKVVGVFSTRENAELARQASDSPYYQPTIAEWPLDPAIDHLRAGRKQYRVRMARDGTTLYTERVEQGYSSLEESMSLFKRAQDPRVLVLCATIFARDEKHAVKIANEHRIQLIAEGKWT